MKKISKLVLAIALFSLSSQTFGQYIAIKGGLNLSNMVIKDNNGTISSDYTNRAGFHAGLMAGIGFGPVAVEGGVLASTKGFNYNDDASSASGNTNLIYLDVPVNLKLRLRLAGIGVYGTVGPVFSFGIGGKTTYDQTLSDGSIKTTQEKINWGTTVNDNLKPMDVGLGLGAGLDLGKISLGVNYIWGLSNIATNTDDGASTNNKVLQFSIGFKIFG
jgi:hypothetical protein